MAQTREAHMAQIDAWQKENITRIVVKFNKKNERDQQLLVHLQRLKADGGSVQAYIKDAVAEKITNDEVV